MALIQEFYQVALLAINRFFKPQIIIPMHYASLPAMSTEAEVRAAIGRDRRVQFMKPGETKQF
jgi:hypothetical protein